MQSFESERNIGILYRLISYLLNKNSDIVLYGYDSFLIDMHPNDKMDIIKDIVDIMVDDNFKIKLKIGASFGDMVQADILV